MPVETRVREEFGKLVQRIKGEDSFGQAAVRTTISQAYLLAMARGKVPGREIIEKFARGYADRGADLHELLVAAGYAEPKDAVGKVEVFLKSADELSEFTKERIRELVAEDVQKARQEK